MAPTRPVPDDAAFDARLHHLRNRILDSIEATLDELEVPEPRHAIVARIVRARVAPLYCTHAICRRAQRCRKTHCAVEGLD